MTDYLATVLPVYLTYKREIVPDMPSSPLNRLRRIFRESLILFPALLFMQNTDFLKYTMSFLMLFIVLNSIYEAGYVWNDWLRIRYDEKPRVRQYVKDLNPTFSIILRIIYVILLSLHLFSSAYIYAIALLLIAILNHNFKTKKIQKAVTLPLMRVAKYMFIPIAMSDLSVDFIGACLILLLPLFMIEGETIAWDVVDHYERLKTSLRFPYYIWFLTFLPFQITLLFKYPIWILSGELVFMLISGVRHR